MEILSTKEVIEIIHDETDIEINSISESKCNLAYAPIDVPASDIMMDNEQNIYIELATVIDKLENEVFGAEIIPMYNAKGKFTHVLIAA